MQTSEPLEFNIDTITVKRLAAGMRERNPTLPDMPDAKLVGLAIQGFLDNFLDEDLTTEITIK
jgi:hypothetical protein